MREGLQQRVSAAVDEQDLTNDVRGISGQQKGDH
jgi:hypothetical protein